MVTTPVPPTPVIRMFHGWDRSVRAAGAGRLASRLAASTFLPLRTLPPCTVTKLGQKPSTQLKSLLQSLWLIARLRPYSVSFGVTDTQKLLAPQSPQPSQTSELTITRFCGSTSLPRFRRRRFSVAQVWS